MVFIKNSKRYKFEAGEDGNLTAKEVT